jgi:hypothetical protein
MENRETQVIEKSEENQASKESSLLSSAAAVRSHCILLKHKLANVYL